MPTSSPLVLVADDEPSMLELVAKHLSMLDDPKLEVIQASDGEEAWRLAREHLPDLVVLDVMMPGMSGWEVCRKIREDVALAHTGVVMLTGIGENLNQMTSPLYGADAYVDKPFEFDDFDDRIRETLRARESQRLGVSRAPINGTSGAAKAAPERREPVEGRVVVKTAPKKAAAPAKKAAAPKKKATAKKAAPKKKATAKTAAPKKKATAKKAAPKKKATAKKAAPAKKTTAKKTTAKKTTAKKTTAKKTTAKKAAPKKKATAKKAAPKKKATARRR